MSYSTIKNYLKHKNSGHHNNLTQGGTKFRITVRSQIIGSYIINAHNNICKTHHTWQINVIYLPYMVYLYGRPLTKPPIIYERGLV